MEVSVALTQVFVLVEVSVEYRGQFLDEPRHVSFASTPHKTDFVGAARCIKYATSM